MAKPSPLKAKDATFGAKPKSDPVADAVKFAQTLDRQRQVAGRPLPSKAAPPKPMPAKASPKAPQGQGGLRSRKGLLADVMRDQ